MLNMTSLVLHRKWVDPFDGMFVGNCVQSREGISAGFSKGDFVGVAVGAIVGAFVGDCIGDDVGKGDGMGDGVFEGKGLMIGILVVLDGLRNAATIAETLLICFTLS